MSPIFAAITGVATVASAIYGIFKWITWKAQKTQDQVNQDIDAVVKAQSQKEQDSGRPE